MLKDVFPQIIFQEVHTDRDIFTERPDHCYKLFFINSSIQEVQIYYQRSLRKLHKHMCTYMHKLIMHVDHVDSFQWDDFDIKALN